MESSTAPPRPHLPAPFCPENSARAPITGDMFDSRRPRGTRLPLHLTSACTRSAREPGLQSPERLSITRPAQGLVRSRLRSPRCDEPTYVLAELSCYPPPARTRAPGTARETKKPDMPAVRARKDPSRHRRDTAREYSVARAPGPRDSCLHPAPASNQQPGQAPDCTGRTPDSANQPSTGGVVHRISLRGCKQELGVLA
jgi:hypothetical protein